MTRDNRRDGDDQHNRELHHRQLSDSERLLWHKVAITVTPLSKSRLIKKNSPDKPQNDHKQDKNRQLPVIIDQESKAINWQNDKSRQQLKPQLPQLQSLTKRYLKQLKRQNIKIDATIDLHGFNLEQAQQKTIHFIKQCYDRGDKTVLIITGKGLRSRNNHETSRQGILNYYIRELIADAKCRPYIIGFEIASQQHGGSGAIYVALRNKNKPR